MKKIKILAIAPYPGLKEVIASVSGERDDVIVHVYEGNLSSGVEIASKLCQNDYDVIVSRGGTSLSIGQVVEIPVVDMEISAYDMIRIIKITEAFPEKTAIVGFSNIANCAHIIGELLDYHVNVFTVNSEHEVADCLSHLREQGYTFVIGDVVTYNMAQKMGMNGVLLTSGRECVQHALDEAVRVCKHLQKLSDKLELYAQVLFQGGEYVEVQNHEGKTIVSTLPENDPAAREAMSEAVKRLKENEEMSEIQLCRDDCVWDARSVHIRAGGGDFTATYLLRRCYGGTRTDDVLSVEVMDGNANSSTMYLFSGIGEVSITDQVDGYADTAMSVLLSGERGVGKRSLAHQLHWRSKKRNLMFIEVDCNRLNEENAGEVFSPGRSVLYHQKGGTVYFRDIEKLPREIQKTVYQYLNSPGITEHFRILASTTAELESLSDEGKFMKKLLKRVGELRICIPPLRENCNKLPSVAGLLISRYNMQYGRQIAGIDPLAMRQMEEFPWYGNIEQFQQVLRELVLQCKGPYISSGEVAFALKNETDRRRGKGDLIHLNGTLEEITREIVNRVLADENMNQSRAAQRLGISRSTMWRKLK